MADVPDHADDHTIADELDDFSDSVLSREIPLGGCLVEDDHWLAVLAIGVRKQPPLQKWHLESPEVFRRNLIQRDICIPWQFPAWNPEVERPEIAAKWQSAGGKRGNFDAGNCTDPVQDIQQQVTITLRGLLNVSWHLKNAHLNRQHIARINTEIDVGHPGKACQKQPRSDEENDG